MHPCLGYLTRQREGGLGWTPPGDWRAVGMGNEETEDPDTGLLGQEMSKEREEGFGPKELEVYAKKEEGREKSRRMSTRGQEKGWGCRVSLGRRMGPRTLSTQ